MSDRLSGPSVLALVGDLSGPSLWRILQPFTALQRRDYPAHWDFKDADGIGQVAPRYAGFVMPRMSWQPGQRAIAEAWFRSLRRAGRFAVYECDDDLFSEELVRRMLAFGWHGGKTAEQLEAMRAERTWALRACDGVTVSTQRLATIVRTLTERPVVVVPNAIDLGWFRRVLRSQPRQVPAPTIGWSGGRRPDEDLAEMAEGWRRVAKRCPSVRFVVGGYVPPVLADAVPPERLVVVPWLPLESYPAGLADVDIACCSVADTPFNRCKTPIKAWEAAAAGATVVATPALYGPTIEHGVTGYLAETADAWEAHLAELVERPALRAIMARRLLKRVEREHSLERELWRWPSAWAQIERAAGEDRILYGVPGGSKLSGILMA